MKDNPRKAIKEVAFLLVLFCCMLMAIEGVTRLFILPTSKIERRTRVEFDAAVATDNKGNYHTILLLGNSLLLHGVKIDALERSLPSGWKTKRIVIESTTFYDWYYGIKNLFSEGCRPDAVVLMLNVNQLITTSIRGEYFGYHLMNFRDVPDVASNLQLHPTAASGLLLGNISAFYGTRVEIRKQLLGLLIPDLADLTQLIVPSQKASITLDDNAVSFRREVRTRLNRLKNLSRLHSIHIAILIAPLYDSSVEKATENIRQVASEIGFDVLEAIRPEDMSFNEFSDGVHLNVLGSTRFTEQLAITLRSYLADKGNLTALQNRTSKLGWSK